MNEKDVETALRKLNASITLFCNEATATINALLDMPGPSEVEEV